MNEVYRDIHQHIPHLRRYARSIARNPVVADDLVQESLLRALAKSHLYRPGTSLRAWLFTILHNQYVSDMRRNGLVGIPVDPDDKAFAIATQPNQESGLVIAALERALRTLPSKQRILLELIALESQSYEEVAASHGLPLGTVKSRVSRGRDQLRKVLEGSTTERRMKRPARGRAPARGNAGREGRLASAG